MSTELAVAIIGLTGVAIPSGVEIWKAWRRKNETRTPAPPPTAQPLREEAVELLSELIMVPMPLNSLDEGGMESAFEGVKARRNKLINLRSRMAVNNGISEEEVTAFSDAATAGGPSRVPRRPVYVASMPCNMTLSGRGSGCSPAARRSEPVGREEPGGGAESTRSA